jgi:CheY-like chemotaxis protein
MKRVLCVDNEPSILDCYRTILGMEGYDVLTTEDPDEALKLLQDEDVKIVLVDVHMPKISGLDLYQELRKQRNLPVLFVTGYPDMMSLESQQTLDMWKNDFMDGVTDILYKPCDGPALLDKVASLIGNS